MAKKKALKLAFIINGLRTGGAEVMLYNLVARLTDEINPHIISLTSIGEIGMRLQALGIPVYSIGINPTAPCPFSIVRLARLLRKTRPVIVSSWLYHANLVGGLAAKLSGVPAIVWGIHNSSDDRSNMKRNTRAIMRMCAAASHALPDLIMCCSKVGLINHIRSGYDKRRCVFVPNGFDIDTFKKDDDARMSVRSKLGIPAESILIGSIGRFHPHKNHRCFIDAAGLMHRMRPDVHFLLAGQRVDEGNGSIMEGLNKAGVTNVTRVLGPRKDVPALIAALDIMSSTSSAEAFPMVVGEAMACGVPCVVTDVGDSSFIVGKTGSVVPPGNPVALSAAWEELIRMGGKGRVALGKRARTRIAENFEIGSVVARYEALYKELAERRCTGGRGNSR